MEKIHLLFSYGTLQLEKVQIESFGRKLKGEKDALSGYKLVPLHITDEKVLARSEKAIHPIAIPTDNLDDQIEGSLFEVTDSELKQADSYEVSDYKRIAAQFKSGKKGWVYVKS